MSEHLLDRANETPVGHPIEIFQAETQAEQIDVLALPKTLEETVAKFGREVPPHHEKALKYDEEPVPHTVTEDADQNEDVIDVIVKKPNRLTGVRALAGLAAVTALVAVDGPNRINEAMDSEKTGVDDVPSATDRAYDRKAKSEVLKTHKISVNYDRGSDGKIKVRSNPKDGTHAPNPPAELSVKNPEPAVIDGSKYAEELSKESTVEDLRKYEDKYGLLIPDHDIVRDQYGKIVDIVEGSSKSEDNQPSSNPAP